MYQPIRDREGQPLGVFVLGNDITRQVMAERELEAIFESFPEALFAGGAGGVTRTNARARDMLGYSRLKDLKRPALAELARVLDADRHRRIVRRARRRVAVGACVTAVRSRARSSS